MFPELIRGLHAPVGITGKGARDNNRKMPKVHIAETGFPEAFPVVLAETDFMAFPGTRNRAAVNRLIAMGVIFDHSFLPVTSSGTTVEE